MDDGGNVEVPDSEHRKDRRNTTNVACVAGEQEEELARMQLSEKRAAAKKWVTARLAEEREPCDAAAASYLLGLEDFERCDFILSACQE